MRIISIQVDDLLYCWIYLTCCESILLCSCCIRVQKKWLLLTRKGTSRNCLDLVKMMMMMMT